MDAVVQRFQLGCLVDHVLRAGDLAAVMQPRSDSELIALDVTHAVLRKRTSGGRNHLVDEHLG
ncbi:hypothetical protein D3C77_777090 [compost metagenome]